MTNIYIDTIHINNWTVHEMEEDYAPNVSVVDLHPDDKVLEDMSAIIRIGSDMSSVVTIQYLGKGNLYHINTFIHSVNERNVSQSINSTFSADSNYVYLVKYNKKIANLFDKLEDPKGVQERLNYMIENLVKITVIPFKSED